MALPISYNVRKSPRPLAGHAARRSIGIALVVAVFVVLGRAGGRVPPTRCAPTGRTGQRDRPAEGTRTAEMTSGIPRQRHEPDVGRQPRRARREGPADGLARDC